jgi:hypothetical protein
MKKVLFAGFAGICVISSIMATPANKGKMNISQKTDQNMRDTIPSKKTDTSRHPKPDTTSMPRILDLNAR